jgi:hypothetical protein
MKNNTSYMKNLFIFCTLVPFLVFGQKKEAKLSPWAIGLVFSPDIFAPANSSPVFYEQQSAYRFGFDAASDFEDNKHWSFRSGLRYSVYKYKLIVFSSNPIPVDLKPYTNIKTQKSIDVPIMARYSVGKKRLLIYGEVGWNLNYEIEQNPTNFEIYGCLSLGLEYWFNNRFSIFAQPTYRKLTKKGTSFSSTGVEMGLKLRLLEK